VQPYNKKLQQGKHHHQMRFMNISWRDHELEETNICKLPRMRPHIYLYASLPPTPISQHQR